MFNILLFPNQGSAKQLRNSAQSLPQEHSKKGNGKCHFTRSTTLRCSALTLPSTSIVTSIRARHLIRFAAGGLSLMGSKSERVVAAVESHKVSLEEDITIDLKVRG
jgi:hypothetical protein